MRKIVMMMAATEVTVMRTDWQPALEVFIIILASHQLGTIKARVSNQSNLIAVLIIVCPSVKNCDFN